jgi:hypothetical protein
MMNAKRFFILASLPLLILALVVIVVTAFTNPSNRRIHFGNIENEYKRCGDCEIVWVGNKSPYRTMQFCCDVFTNEIMFITEYELYATNTHFIRTTMSITTVVPSSLMGNPAGFHLLRYEENEWREMWFDINRTYTSFYLLMEEEFRSIGIHRDQMPNSMFLPGRYRIVLDVRLAPHKGKGITGEQLRQAEEKAEQLREEGYENWMNYLPPFPLHYEGQWHTIWAEFTITDD